MKPNDVDPSDSANTLDALLLRARKGDEQALGQLVTQCRDYLMLIANEDLHQDLQGKFGASDFVQQTMMVAVQKFTQFRGTTPEELKGWLRQILKNDLFRAYRQYAGTSQREIAREVPLAENNNVSQLLVDHCSTPRSDAVLQEEARLLRVAMDQLPENYRNAVRLREWEELSFAEIGSRLQVSEEAARKLYRRGMDRLQQILRPMIASPLPSIPQVKPRE